ncbi:MAG TPA: PAS domain S-box protein [Pyrinomonadaceae bacterium]|jgi:PAS domain S-box-containing protein
MRRKETPTRPAPAAANGGAAEPHDVAQARLAAIVESSEDAIISKTLDGVITSWNAAAERMYGYTAEEAVGRHISLIVPGELAQQLEEIHASLRRGEGVSHLETTRVRRDGARVEVAVSISPVKNAAGETVGAASIARDIGARRRVEEERTRLATQVEEERRRLRDLVASVPGVVWESWGEPDGSGQRINFVSDYVEQMLGYTKEEWLSTPNFWLRIVHPEDRERAAAEARRKFDGSGGVSEFRWVRRDGRVLPVEARSAPVLDDAGRPVGMRGVTMDVSERKAAEAELGRRVHQAALGAEVGAAFAEGGVPVEQVLRRCAESVVRHLDAAFARIWTLERGADVLELRASAGMYTHLDGAHGRVPVGQFKIGLIAAERRPHLTNSVVGDPRVGDQEWARREGMVAFAGYPLLVEDRVAGVLAMFARNELPADTLEALSSVANVIAQGIERRRAEEALAALLHEREQTIAEVSTPVVPVLDGVLVLPLIGSLDTERTARATRAALQEVARQGARVCILDITGARLVDSHAVANLTNLVQALRLVGAEACVTGVGAHVAQTLVRLGLDMRGLRTYRTLAQALAALAGGRRAF